MLCRRSVALEEPRRIAYSLLDAYLDTQLLPRVMIAVYSYYFNSDPNSKNGWPPTAVEVAFYGNRPTWKRGRRLPRRKIVVTAAAEAENPNPASNCAIRPPSVEDGANIWRLVRDSGVLDTNSCYAYLLLGRDFADTCLVADSDAGLLGFVTGYIPPRKADTLFVWQIAVAATARRTGLASRLLQQLARRAADSGVGYIEATIAPSNAASHRLFARLAEWLGVPLEIEQGFTAEQFGGENHEDEQTIRIGPFTTTPT